MAEVVGAAGEWRVRGWVGVNARRRALFADNDTRILSVARSLATEGESVVLVSKDLPLRIKAAAIGLAAQEYRAELPPDSGWTGMREVEVGAAEVDELYANGIDSFNAIASTP